ncbi:MAG: T9SS type A sorting domain-containing protein [Syntrophomonadaceae bacterium]
MQKPVTESFLSTCRGLVFIFFIFVSSPISAQTRAISCGGLVTSEQGASHTLITRENYSRLINGQLKKSSLADSTTIVFGSSVPKEFSAYITALVREILPAIKLVYGPPIQPSEITVNYDISNPGWFFYDPKNHQILISALPGSVPYAAGMHNPYQYDDDNDGRIDEDPFDGMDNDLDGKIDEDYDNDPRWDGVFTHEVIHSFHDGILLVPSWCEEGMTEAAEELVQKVLVKSLKRDILNRSPEKNICFYDTWNSLGGNIVGGVDYPLFKSMPQIYYNQTSALFWMLCMSYENEPAPGDWQALNFFRHVNYYLRSKTGVIYDYQLLQTIESLYVNKVDGKNVVDWIRNQAITNYSGSMGRNLVVLAQNTVVGSDTLWSMTNPVMGYVYAFERKIISYGRYNYLGEEIITSPSPVYIKIKNADGITVWDNSGSGVYLRSRDDLNVFSINPSSPLAPGAYSIEASVLMGQDTLKAQNVFLVIRLSSRQDIIKSASHGMGILAMNRDGNLFPAELTSGNSSFLLHEKAGYLLQTELKPRTHLDLDFTYGKNNFTFTLPNPFTRIIPVTVNPAPAPRILKGWPDTVGFSTQPFLRAVDMNNDKADEIFWNGATTWWNNPMQRIDSLGGPVEKWNIKVASGSGNFSTAFGDINNDGELDIVAPGALPSNDYILRAYNMNGSVIKEWNALAYSRMDTNPLFLEIDSSHKGPELVIGTVNFQTCYINIYATDQQGTLLRSFQIPELYEGWPYIRSISGGDLDKDGWAEIVGILESGYGSDVRSFIFYYDYNNPGAQFWSYRIGSYMLNYPKAVIGDLDKDGQYEIVVSAAGLSPYDGSSPAGQVFIFNTDGSIKKTWNINTYYSSASLADLNGDGILEIINVNENGVYVWNPDGTKYKKWPRLVPGPGCQALVADINDDGIQEIIAAKGSALYIWQEDGTLLNEMRFWDNESGYFTNTQTLCDINGDGKIDLLSYIGRKLYAFDLGGTYDKSKLQWAMEGYDINSGGMYIPGYYLEVNNENTASRHPETYALLQNYPNPFNPSTTIIYRIPEQSNVELKVFDILGREVMTLINKEQTAGEYKVTFNASTLPSGVYIYAIRAGDFRSSKKLMILK